MRPSLGSVVPAGAVRAAVFAAAGVLAPLLGAAASAGQRDSGGALWITILACGGTVVWTRRSLSQVQALAAMGGAQAAFHTAYTLPGACGGGHAGWEALAGHVVMFVLAVRLLGGSDSLVRPLRTVLKAARQSLALPPADTHPLLRVPVVPTADSGWAPAGFRAPPRRTGRAPPYSAVVSPLLFSRLPAPRGGAIPA